MLTQSLEINEPETVLFWTRVDYNVKELSPYYAGEEYSLRYVAESKN